jgi:hypothetical protein
MKEVMGQRVNNMVVGQLNKELRSNGKVIPAH